MTVPVTTIIIEPHVLLRTALESLMENHSYRVVGGFASTADLSGSAIVGDAPLVILGAQSTDKACAEAMAVRHLFPESKIVLLFEHASQGDFEKLLASKIDGCVPLSVSPSTLINVLDLILERHVRMIVVGDAGHPLVPPLCERQSDRESPRVGEFQALPAERRTVPMRKVATSTLLSSVVASDIKLDNVDGQFLPAMADLPRLSEREVQILDGLVKGNANKVIARKCAISEATVKVHMKSILRKIRVSNRTQAAIWALEHGYSGAENKDPAAEGRAVNGIASVG
jgi:two-component system nitrate/nitrite response regulator NarL